jgi:hypothetical protein
LMNFSKSLLSQICIHNLIFKLEILNNNKILFLKYISNLKIFISKRIVKITFTFIMKNSYRMMILLIKYSLLI